MTFGMSRVVSYIKKQIHQEADTVHYILNNY